MTHRDQHDANPYEGHFVIGICILLLALSVFGWGLHSKLSLYHVRTHPSATAPVAKLLSERERPALQTQHCDVNAADIHVLAIAAVAALLPHPQPRIAHRMDAEPSPPLSPIAYQGPSLRRPPPSLLA